MRIAQISPIAERIPPSKYGGTERVVYEITEELARRGHEVTLFAVGDSLTSARLVSVYPKGLREAKMEDLYGPNVLSMLNIGTAYKMQEEFDIIHDHNGHLSLATANVSSRPVIMTHHGPFTPHIRRLYKALQKPFVVSISESQVRGISDINLMGNVYNGLSMEDYPFSSSHRNYLLFVGRISYEKGVHHAIETALYLNLPLIIAAKLEPFDVPYFKQYVRPYLSENIRWIGEVTQEERNNLMSRAMCFLHPVTWKEPFGLTLIEAMACGAPVVAFGRGSIPEIIRDGETGFIVSDLDEMIEAIEKIDTIDRRECRRHALKNFSAKVMVDKYEEIYRKVLRLARKEDIK